MTNLTGTVTIAERTKLHEVLALLGVHGTDVLDEETSILKNVQIYQHLIRFASKEQLITLDKCARLKWKFSKIICNESRCIVLLSCPDSTAWVLPDGELLRPPPKKKFCKPPKEWRVTC